jgi:hypothetical protein
MSYSSGDSNIYSNSCKNLTSQLINYPTNRVIVNMDLSEIICEDMYGIYLAQDRDQWRALVNTTMNLLVS